MSAKMLNVMRELREWLDSHDVPAEGVRVIIESPRRDMPARAQAAMRMEFEDYLLFKTPPAGTEIMGIKLNFQVQTGQHSA